MSSKKILVTGGAGYIGAHTAVELIQAGYEPVIIDDLSKSNHMLLDGIEKITDKKNNFIKGDCCDTEFLKGVFKTHGPFMCVLHFAAYKAVGESVSKPLEYYRNNLNSLVCLLEVMKEFNITNLIFSSSCTVYGQPDAIPVTETAPFKRAESPYGATKQMCERILEDASVLGFRITSLRYFNPIGAHPSALIGELPIGVPNNLVPYITQVAIGKREKLTVFGDNYNTRDGSCVRDFIHVVDVALAHVSAMEHLNKISDNKTYDTFNLGTGIGFSVLELIRTFEKVTGKKLNYVIGPRRDGDIEKVFADPSKVNAHLQWKTKFSIEEALLHAWQWEKNLSAH